MVISPAVPALTELAVSEVGLLESELLPPQAARSAAGDRGSDAEGGAQEVAPAQPGAVDLTVAGRIQGSRIHLVGDGHRYFLRVGGYA